MDARVLFQHRFGTCKSLVEIGRTGSATDQNHGSPCPHEVDGFLRELHPHSEAADAVEGSLLAADHVGVPGDDLDPGSYCSVDRPDQGPGCIGIDCHSVDMARDKSVDDLYFLADV